MQRRAKDLTVGTVIQAGGHIGMITSIDVQDDGVFAVVKSYTDRWIKSWEPGDMVELDLMAA